jgi:short-subunit dehydrogenase
MTIKQCLLTGASGGIGSALAKALAKQGYSLILQGRNEQKLNTVLESLTGEVAGSHRILIADLTNQTQRTRCLNEAFANGPIELLVNAAGISEFNAFENVPPEKIKTMFDVNLLSPILLTQDFLQRVGKQQPCTVINIGSTLGAIGFAGFNIYCASKFGLRGFTESLARELADTNVRVAYFSPRTTKTQINSDKADEMNQALGNKIDSTDVVAQQFIKLLHSKKRRRSVGWPEKFFVRLNGVLPEIVDKALNKQLTTIKRFF